MEKIIIIDLKGNTSRSLFTPHDRNLLNNISSLVQKIKANRKVHIYSVDKAEYLKLLKDFDKDCVVYIINH